MRFLTSVSPPMVMTNHRHPAFLKFDTYMLALGLLNSLRCSEHKLMYGTLTPRFQKEPNRSTHSERVQVVAVAEQVKLPRMGQAIKVAITCASAQSIERTVSKYWCDPGRNSRKIALSTGRLPPTPKDQKAATTDSTINPRRGRSEVCKTHSTQ